MKQAPKNDIDMVVVINKIQTQLLELGRKIDVLINRSSPQVKAVLPPVDRPSSIVKPHDHNQDRNKTRHMYTAICADCKKECSIPFKPSGDRPVYCQDCFSRRRVINLSKIGSDPKPQETAAPVVNKPIPKASPVIKKKKAVTVKKPVVKKKLAPKKK